MRARARTERLANTLASIDRAVEEKEKFLERMDFIHKEHGVPGAGGLLAALDASIDERSETLNSIDQLTKFITDFTDSLDQAAAAANKKPGVFDPGAKAKELAAAAASAKANALAAEAKPGWNPHF
jgi:hypothetical protein